MERIFAPVLCIVNPRPDLPDAFVAMPDLSRGVHCSLYNDAWGTNYIMWFGENVRSRFRLRMEG